MSEQNPSKMQPKIVDSVCHQTKKKTLSIKRKILDDHNTSIRIDFDYPTTRTRKSKPPVKPKQDNQNGGNK